MKKIKRIISITLMLSTLLVGNVFSAVVIDNDGEAFITKAEFEAMISKINEGVNTYYATVDNTIDAAIIDYIAGLGEVVIESGNTIKYPISPLN